MSPRADSYLSMCLEQAAMSPLHYRHGCIIVRGGKVIGQGFNDYRPGFDGGALKTGRLCAGSFDGPAIAELKQKQKQKQKHKLKPKDGKDTLPNSTKTFTPFEGNGGGHEVNVPLSMHAEMMAVHSALSASSNLASSALLSQKPCFKLPSNSKRKARLRREGIEAYVAKVCGAAIEQQTAQRRGKSQVKYNKEEANQAHKEDEAVASLQDNGGEKHRTKNQYRGHHGTMYQYDPSGQKQQQQCKQYAHKTFRAAVEEPSETTADQVEALMGPEDAKSCPSLSKYYVRGRGCNNVRNGYSPVDSSLTSIYREQQPKQSAPRDDYGQPQTMLLPKGRSGQTSRSVSERMRHPRLNGADLYVARYGWRKEENAVKQSARCSNVAVVPADSTVEPCNSRKIDLSDEEANPSLAEVLSSVPSGDTSPPLSASVTAITRERSLHDELTCVPVANNSAQSAPVCPPSFDPSAVHASRPCYRCVSYMHSVGIKRVFWTNDKGQWEGSKVRDLVDALEGPAAINSVNGRGGNDGSGGKGNGMVSTGSAGLGLFVTKHEVLMLRRLMGRKVDG